MDAPLVAAAIGTIFERQQIKCASRGHVGVGPFGDREAGFACR